MVVTLQPFSCILSTILLKTHQKDASKRIFYWNEVIKDNDIALT